MIDIKATYKGVEIGIIFAIEIRTDWVNFADQSSSEVRLSFIYFDCCTYTDAGGGLFKPIEPFDVYLMGEDWKKPKYIKGVTLIERVSPSISPGVYPDDICNEWIYRGTMEYPKEEEEILEDNWKNGLELLR